MSDPVTLGASMRCLGPAGERDRAVLERAPGQKATLLADRDALTAEANSDASAAALSSPVADSALAGGLRVRRAVPRDNLSRRKISRPSLATVTESGAITTGLRRPLRSDDLLALRDALTLPGAHAATSPELIGRKPAMIRSPQTWISG
ncbi:MAG: hypothetical protein U1E70_16575 [Acetobacteraceae bacterium]